MAAMTASRHAAGQDGKHGSLLRRFRPLASTAALLTLAGCATVVGDVRPFAAETGSPAGRV